MDTTYNPNKYEDKCYRFWEEQGYFEPQIDLQKEPFVITLPPPNVTGGLHAGHAMYVLEDIMIRYHRMKGDPTLWLPGFDHASIAVEYLVTKQLLEEGKSKQEVGREVFLDRAEKFADESRNYIRSQLKKLGFSLDWSREAYTMDEQRSEAVNEAFKRLYEKGLIYKDDYIVNWCPDCGTAISNLENEYQEEAATFYYIKYGDITIATTRPETMFADVAVAVHPEDPRYQDRVGETVPLPLTDRELPVIADEAVDPEFGTGALKITPAHDATDFEIGERHNLESPKAISREGNLTEITGKYVGMAVEEARSAVVNDLKEQGYLEKTEELVHRVGHCQRCGTNTEPMVSKQWFVATTKLAKPAIEAVKEGKIEILPKHFEKVFFHWMENIHDWCISRQLWWGHPIPLQGEEDVLDTWFSSSLWPISTLGWPGTNASRLSLGISGSTRNSTALDDFEYFYPTTVRETGYDILFFWVAKEIMMCIEMTGKVPFRKIYLHGLVRDEQGRKFSKTKGIGFDPLEMIEQYGADALRMALVVGSAPGNDISLGEDKIRGYRNFTNKLWNIARFILMNFPPEADGPLEEEGSVPFYSKEMESELEEKDLQIVRDLENLIIEVNKNFENFRFDLAGEDIYQFVWHRFADEYIEYSKDRIQDGDRVVFSVLRHVFLNSIKLLHPFMPYITEELWSRFPRRSDEALIISKWPNAGDS